nr:MAG TPA: hypothetical protein [Caudoviricetes sp.]
MTTIYKRTRQHLRKAFNHAYRLATEKTLKKPLFWLACRCARSY